MRLKLRTFLPREDAGHRAAIVFVALAFASGLALSAAPTGAQPQGPHAMPECGSAFAIPHDFRVSAGRSHWALLRSQEGNQLIVSCRNNPRRTTIAPSLRQRLQARGRSVESFEILRIAGGHRAALYVLGKEDERGRLQRVAHAYLATRLREHRLVH